MPITTSIPTRSASKTLSDLALNAAIELERFQIGKITRLEAVRDLAAALSERGVSDLGLVPVYNRALAVGGAGVTSRNDLYSKLANITRKLETASDKDINILRDFCVALHDALLTKRLQSIRPPVLAQRR